MPKAPDQKSDQLEIIKNIERVLDNWDNGNERPLWSGYNPNMNKATAVFQMLRDSGFLRAQMLTGPKPKRPRDPNQFRKLIVDLSVGEVDEVVTVEPPKNEAATALGRIGGAARAKAMTPERRAEIARKAAAKRWGKSD